jgi:hypothetical protein
MSRSRNNYQVPFVREEEGHCTTIAIVRITTLTPVTSQEEQIKTIQDAVTEWVRSTEDGKEGWKISCEDFNIGDLSQYEDTFRAWLKTAYKGNLRKMEFIALEDTGDSIAFDCPLVLAD